MKVYAVYSIPKSPEYKLEKLFMTKGGAKEYIKNQKDVYNRQLNTVYDIQLEDVGE